MGLMIDRTLLVSSRFAAQTPELDSNIMINRAATFGNFELHMSRLARKHNQVFGRIVVPVPIDMMNNLALLEGPSKVPFSDDPMDSLPANLEVILCVQSLVGSTAGVRAIDAPASTNLRRLRIELVAALRAFSIFARSPAGRIAHLRAPSAIAGLAARFACIVHTLIIPRSKERNNRWFSPACIKPTRVRSLFDAMEAS